MVVGDNGDIHGAARGSTGGSDQNHRGIRPGQSGEQSVSIEDFIVCTGCKRSKATSSFHRKAEKKNGYDSRCKRCVSTSRRKRRRRQKRVTKTMRDFIVSFNGAPDKRLLVARLKPTIEDMKRHEG